MKAMEIIGTWYAMSDAEQQAIVRNCVLKAIRKGRKIMPGDSLEDVLQATFLTVLERLTDTGSLDAAIQDRETAGYIESIQAFVMRCANSVLQNKIYRAKKDSCIIDNITTCEDGEFDLLDAIPANGNTEQSAVIRVAVQSLQESQDNIGGKILEMLVQGFTEREIASSVGISNVAVHKRIVKMRSALKDLLA